jgi:PKD repeat protein
VQYQDLSKRGDGQLLSWQWDFGDGNTSKDSQASHSFKVAGFYTNSLLVTDVHGCQDKFIVQDYIEVKPSAEIEIQADQRYSCTAPFTVYFKDKSKKVSSGDLYTWHFGDGDSSNQVNPVHTYTKKGNYTVSLKIKKVNGCVSSKTYAKYIVVDNLQANFEADKTLACSPSTIFFTNTSSPQIPGVSFIWDFGDGTQSFGVNPQHTYTNPGVYTVSLTVLGGSCSKKETALNYIKIDPSPVPDFTLSDSISCKVPLNIFCYDQSTNASKIEWTLLECNVNLGNTKSTVAVIKD